MPKSILECAKAGYRAFRFYRWHSDILEDAFRLSAGLQSRECPICGFVGRFRPFGFPPRVDAVCSNCGSLERHRLLKLWLDRSGLILKNAKVLHFAPETAVREFLREAADEYLGADLDGSKADLVLDIEAIDLDEASVDVVVCSHVLEHVNDAKALTSICRVLRPGGLAIFMIPIVEGWDRTYENDSIQTAHDREVHFAQWDHVRYYGQDFRERVRDCGFDLDEFTAVEPDVSRFGLQRGEKVFLARKPAT